MYVELVHHEKSDKCEFVDKINSVLDTYISLGLDDPSGYKHNPPNISTEMLSSHELVTALIQTTSLDYLK